MVEKAVENRRRFSIMARRSKAIMYPKLSRQLAVTFMLAVLTPFFAAPAVQNDQPCTVQIIPQGNVNNKFTAIVLANAQACLASLSKVYFQVKFSEPLTIYLSATTGEGSENTRTAEGAEATTARSEPVAYVNLSITDDEPVSLEPLFASIAGNLVHRQFSGAPLWFRTGLIDFFSKDTRIVDGNLISGGPRPSAALALRAELEAETRLNLKKLYVSSDERYRQWETGPYLTAALLNWLQQTGHLADYIRLAREKGYGFEVLVEATALPAGRVNIEFNRFIENDYCIAAYLAEAEDANSTDAKEKALQTALAARPDCSQAQLALAKLYCDTGRYGLSRSTLAPLLARAEDPEFLPAARLAAEDFYRSRDYAEARQYYIKAWEKARYCPDRYRLAYRIGNCSHYLDEPKVAAKWYATFLELNFRPEQEKRAVDYARKYVETFGSPTSTASAGRGDE
jgi:tetratricopeptide (TPR) repeat protein